MWWKILLATVAAVFVGIQFVRPPRNLSTVASPNDIMVRHPPPPDVKRILETACYDCHSNRTRYPWYAEVQPFGWWLAQHVKEGKAELNFSEFGTYSAKRATRKLEASVDEITSRAMPLKSYLFTHADAKLTPEQIKQFTAWADAVMERIEEGAP